VEIIQTKRADLNGDGVIDTIYLTGEKEKPQDIFIRNIALEIEDGKTRKITKITFSNNAGYNPRLFIGDFNKDKIDDVMISIDSGGSGGFGFYYIYSFAGNISRMLFDNEEFNQEFKYDVIYKEGCKVQVYSYQLKKTYIIDVSEKQKGIYAEIYNKNCKLLKPTSGFVPGLNNLYPLATDEPGSYNLLAISRVIGLYGADTLGYLETVLEWNGTKFVPRTETLKIN